MRDPTTIAFVLFASGLVLLTAGFAVRQSSIGLLSMWIGIVTVLATVAYYIIEIV